jgi:ABC-type Na+ transport system ATPase subunit NatA
LILPRGALAYVEGPNGAGKTTLLRIIAGLLAPDAGRIRIAGATFEDGPVIYRRRIGLASAGNVGLYARMSPQRHLEFATRLAMMRPETRAPAIHQMTEAFGLRDILRRRVDRLSMGQRQRVRLALAFVHRPLVALLDEPSTSLDTQGESQLLSVIDAHRARGRCAVWCGPSGAAAPSLATVHLVLREGRLHPA